MKDLRVLIIVPALNEAESLEHLLPELYLKCPQFDFVVVDDGSTDRTADVARSLGPRTLLELPFNLGIGGAVQCGIRYAFEQGYDVCVQCDGDGQHDPAEIESLVSALVEQGADLAIGSRFINSGGFRSTFARRVGIAVVSSWIQLFSGRRISDPTSGFRAMSRRLMKEFSNEYPRQYPEPESIYAALHRGFRVAEHPVRMRVRRGGQSSIRSLESALYVVKICIAIAVDALRRTGNPARK
ncbi:MAG: glycosyltransferase family 2 protein [Planctomycetota bacterium]|nr:glycosyltransferase family 2 protein [Planctomycetota bacterium]